MPDHLTRKMVCSWIGSAIWAKPFRWRSIIELRRCHSNLYNLSLKKLLFNLKNFHKKVIFLLKFFCTFPNKKRLNRGFLCGRNYRTLTVKVSPRSEVSFTAFLDARNGRREWLGWWFSWGSFDLGAVKLGSINSLHFHMIGDGRLINPIS